MPCWKQNAKLMRRPLKCAPNFCNPIDDVLMRLCTLLINPRRLEYRSSIADENFRNPDTSVRRHSVSDSEDVDVSSVIQTHKSTNPPSNAVCRSTYLLRPTRSETAIRSEMFWWRRRRRYKNHSRSERFNSGLDALRRVHRLQRTDARESN